MQMTIDGAFLHVRADIRLGTLEKRFGLAPGYFRNPDGTRARRDKKLGTLRAQFGEQSLALGAVLVPVPRITPLDPHNEVHPNQLSLFD